MGKIIKVSGKPQLTRDHIVKIGDTLYNFDEVDSVSIDVKFKDNSSISYESDGKEIVDFFSDKNED